MEVQYCKEQHCIGTENGRSINQGKLQVVKQEMVRVNIILRISDQNGPERANLIQMAIKSSTVGKNLLEEIE